MLEYGVGRRRMVLKKVSLEIRVGQGGCGGGELDKVTYQTTLPHQHNPLRKSSLPFRNDPSKA
jgi:hypothetical protein